MLIAWASRPRFDSEDIANGTLVLNWVDPPPITLSLDFINQRYQVWANDSTPSLAGLVGYYQVKG